MEKAGPGSPELNLPLWKKLIYGLISTVIVLFFLAILGELALRVVVVFVPSFRSSPFRQYDPVLGESLIPNIHVIHSRGCFSGTVVTNRWGMRDRDRNLEKPPGEYRIALLGDSIVEAAQVQPDEVVNIRLEKLLADGGRKNTEVPAFGIAGIGTTQELLLYQTKVRQFHPDLVVLSFVDNDLMNNSSTLQPRIYGIHTWYAPYYNLGPDGKLVFQPVEGRLFNGLQAFLERHSLLTYYIEHAWQRVDIGDGKWENLPLEWGEYGDPPDKEWSDAWTVTGKTLKMLQQAVEADGSKFIVLKIPGFYDISPDWQERFKKEVGNIPPNMNVFSLEARLKEVGQRENIPVDFLGPYMRAYRESHNLQHPYFSFTCETHYSALGNEVEAEAIYQKLLEHNLLPPPDSGTAVPPAAK